jgi:two-component system LytT family sensor kinase
LLQEPAFLTPYQSLLITLVVKVAVILLLAITLVRYHRFRDILIHERRTWQTRLVFVVSLAVPLAAGVGARILIRYDAADLSMEGALLTGLIVGPTAGVLLGALVGAPALAGGELAALPFAMGCGLAGGVLRELCPKEEIWKLSTFVFLDLHRYAWRLMRRLRLDWQVVLLSAPVSLELVRQAIGHRWPGRIFHPAAPAWLEAIVILTTVICVTAPIRIWNNARTEHRLQEQEKLLLSARLEALTSQINPHFLFNTLASISSLIRTQPDTARALVVQLSALLRRRLSSHDPLIPLGDELSSVDEYLAIEAVRFGARLRIEKQVGPDTLDLIVPSMMLQPLVENAIKHGLAAKVDGGVVTIRSRIDAGRAVIEVEDDGSGMEQAQLDSAIGAGIGLKNVQERLRVFYGVNGALTLNSSPGRGTIVRIEIPAERRRDAVVA